ncbi:tRNA N(3)-cytidine methyltransferase METTL2 [Eucyclogobius newberryi]|uniref:tRNA N(3)-cytidine methyltransferase METTL2 n=1 Tax=Eucyclogobius newberryi TaxID=166745 RepID=UPI003B5A9D55
MAVPHAAHGAEEPGTGETGETQLILPDSASEEGKRPQFGTRFLTDPRQVFQHNAWDNVEWTEEQESAAKKKVLENSQPLPAEKQEEFDTKANSFWNEFYTVHENRFFKDRHWLFTEFPELAPQRCSGPGSPVEKPGPEDAQRDGAAPELCRGVEALALAGERFPGATAAYRILEVGCGVGNTVFPILKTNNDPSLFVYCCDFSSTAVELVKTNPEYDPGRCFAFVHDMSDVRAGYPIPDGTLDVLVLIFVLSALHPDKMQESISRLARLLKPGGMMLLRDYGRYDMAQLRFKKGRCLSENFYVRGDGTRVYFFTQDELHVLFASAGLEKVQNLVDRRLQVNRGKQLTMYRVWIQCKYRKGLERTTGTPS